MPQGSMQYVSPSLVNASFFENKIDSIHFRPSLWFGAPMKIFQPTVMPVEQSIAWIRLTELVGPWLVRITKGRCRPSCSTRSKGRLTFIRLLAIDFAEGTNLGSSLGIVESAQMFLKIVFC